ncbi:MAG: cysteine desulfurase, partial [Lachnospiraceae bacterium]|nr:cysteine desulfurase [Lachnospiraceae bacterium]
LVTTQIEHHAVLESASYLKEHGFMVTFVKPGADGLISAEDIKNAIREDTVLVSVMSVNNETGVYQPIEEIAKICKERDVYFHTDAVQGYGKISFKEKLSNIDLLIASAHKFNGPKGAGFLYVKNGTIIKPFVHGGSQERGLRAGTENIAAIAAMGEAAKIANDNLSENAKKVDELYNLLKSLIEESIPNIRINGIKNASGIGVLNVCFKGVEGSTLLIHLDMEGICASSGAACVQSLDEPSHVLLAMGLSEEDVRSSIRLSLSHENTKEEVEYLANVLKEKVEYLRSMRL